MRVLGFIVAAALLSLAAGWVDGGGAVFLPEEEGEGDEDEPEPPKRDSIAAGMLLASVVYMTASLGMALQQQDRKLRKLTLSALNTKISIFIAVLMYQAVKGVLLVREEEEHPEWGSISRTFCFMFFWFVVLQLLMMSITYKAFNWMWKEWVRRTKNVEKKHLSDKVKFEKIWDREREILLGFWATLMGHVVGFACIDGYAKVQDKMHRTLGGIGVCLTIPIAALLMTGWYVLAKKVRVKVNECLVRYDYKEQVEAGGKTESQVDAKVDQKLDRINEAAQDTENDAIALTISFLFCQAFRLYITSHLPNGEGLEERHLTKNSSHHLTDEIGSEPAYGGKLAHPRTYGDIALLWAMSYVLFILVLCWRDCKCFNPAKKWFEEVVKDGEERLERVTEIASDTASMTVAWSGFFGMTWLLDTVNRLHCSVPGSEGHHTHFNCGSGGMTGSVFLALACTLLAYFIIIVLAKASEPTACSTCNCGANANLLWHDLAESALKAQGLLIGFSWEKSFDLAVEDISDKVDEHHRNLYRFGVSFFVCLMVGLVWKLFLLPRVLSHQNEDEAVELASKIFKMPHEDTRGGDAAASDEGSRPLAGDNCDKERDARTDELLESFEETLKEYNEEVERAQKMAAKLQKEAEGAIEALRGTKKDGKWMYTRDGRKMGEDRAIVFNKMTRALRRYEDIMIVETSEE